MAPDRDHQDAKHQLGLSRVRRVLGGALAFGCFCLKCRGIALFFPQFGIFSLESPGGVLKGIYGRVCPSEVQEMLAYVVYNTVIYANSCFSKHEQKPGFKAKPGSLPKNLVIFHYLQFIRF